MSRSPWLAYSWMMCQRIGRAPISTSGLGIDCVCSCSRVPRPPQRITTFTPGTLVAQYLPESSHLARVDEVRSAWADPGVDHEAVEHVLLLVGRDVLEPRYR